MTIEAGKTYFGPHDERRVVTAVQDGVVSFHSKLTFTPSTASLAEFEEWRLQSDWRIYYPEDYSQRRAKLGLFMVPDGEGGLVEKVRYYLPETYDVVEVEPAEWDAWRAALPDA